METRRTASATAATASTTAADVCRAVLIAPGRHGETAEQS
jgi:hypothetical protein